MKRILKYFAGLLTVLLLLSSCDTWIDTSINVDPDAPQDVPLNLLVPSIQARLAYSFGGNEAVRVPGLWVQHYQGVTRQSATQGNTYVYGNSDPNNYWNAMYNGTMMDCEVLIGKAAEEESPHYEGVAKVCKALAIGQITDFFGDVPLRDAFQGVDQLSPAFDSQQQIYGDIQTMLDEAITALSSTSNAVPLSGDMIFGGDTDAWIKAAYAIKARYLIHTTAVDGGAAAAALALLGNAFTSSADDMLFQWGSASTESSPLFQFMRDRGDIRLGHTFIAAMDADGDSVYTAGTDDPRLPVIAGLNSADQYVGGIIGISTDADDLSSPNPTNDFYRADGHTMFMSYTEQLFIEAEATIRGGGNGATALQAAVMSSMNDFGAVDSAWFNANIASIANPDLTDVFQQKWIALFGQGEIFNDWRRSDNEIGLAISPSANLSQIPYRFPYATSEQTYNSNCPQGRDLVSPMWWMGSKNPSPTK